MVTLTSHTPPQPHRFDARQDEDWFALNLPTGLGQYTVTVTTDHSQTDTIIFLYAPNQQTLLAQNDDCSYLTQSSCLTWIAFGKGPYYLQVKPTETVLSFHNQMIMKPVTNECPTPQPLPRLTPVPAPSVEPTVIPHHFLLITK